MKSRRHGNDQVAALPLRFGASRRVEVMLITSRETQRWVIPKGWPAQHLRDWDAAAREAEEEAGLKGDVGARPLGRYAYFKRGDGRFQLLDVTVYPLWVREHATRWKEQGQRDARWLEPEQAALLVQEPGLQAILHALASTPAAWRLAS